ncbi:hypothetical protein V5N11_026648 [Cardamine amara subsp. amara]
MGYRYVQFASSNQAKMALLNKNGEYLHDHKILLGVARKEEYISRPKYCINHKVWYKDDYLGPESLVVEEDDETVEGGLDEYPYFVEDAAIRKRRFLLPISLPKLKYQISSISSKMLEKLFVFNFL